MEMEIMNMKLQLDVIQMYTLVLFVIGLTYVAYVKTKEPSDFVKVLTYTIIFAIGCAPILARIFRVI